MSITYTFTPGWSMTERSAPAATPDLHIPWYNLPSNFVPTDVQKDTSVYKCLNANNGENLSLTIQSRRVANVYANVPSIGISERLPNVAGQAIYVNIAGTGDIVQTITSGSVSQVNSFLAPVNASVKLEVPSNPGITPDVMTSLLGLLMNALYTYSATGTANASQLDGLLRGSRALPL